MLDKEYIKKLLAQNEYQKISEYLYMTYSNILEEFIKKNGGSYKKETLIVKAGRISREYPKYSNLMNMLLEIMLDENETLIDRLNEMIDFYPILKKNLI